MVRTPCCKEEGIKKGAWTPEEDQKLIAYLQLHGEGGWRTLPEKAGLKRCGKSCRLRWANYLRPDIKRGDFSLEEDNTIIKLHALKGNKWAAIASSLVGRTDNDIKNYWNTNLKKRFKQKGIDLGTHKPINLTGIKPEKHKPVGSSTSARLLNRVASKFAVDLNRELLTGIISGNSSITEVSQNSGEVDSVWVDSPTSPLFNQMAAKSSVFISTSSDDYSFSDDFNVEISDMCTNVDNDGFMEELNGMLSYGGAGTGVIEDSPEVNETDQMEILKFWIEEDIMDLDKFARSLDSEVGVFL